MASLDRFLKAQEDSYSRALREIQSGQKKSHWMWYIFPQLKGLGRSETALYYGIKDLKEAQEYTKNKVLWMRLLEITQALREIDTSDPTAVFGSPDDKKLRSSMTLFLSISGDTIFQKVLDKFYHGEMDPVTLRMIKEQKKDLNKKKSF